MKYITSSSIEVAQKHYPTLRKTVYLATKHDMKLVGHFAQMTKKGKVARHWWVVLDNDTNTKESRCNQEVLDTLKIFDEIKSKQTI
jgi:hypothetical protein